MPDVSSRGRGSALPPDDVLGRRVKAELRKRMRAVRQTMPLDACRERSLRIVSTLAAHPAVERAKAVALFWPMLERHEVDLRELDRSLRARGCAIAYPGMGEEGEILFRFVQDPSTLAPRDLGFAEPGDGDPLVGGTGKDLSALEVVVLPALAVDPRGHRIGYGRGLYDRALKATRGATRPLTIAVAFDFQLVMETPATPLDEPAALVVTDRRTLVANDPAVTGGEGDTMSSPREEGRPRWSPT